jgi:hypothetical protein
MTDRIANAILSRIDHGVARIGSEEIAEEIFGAHYAASDDHAAARLRDIQDLLKDTDWSEIPEGSGARWYWERALEQFRVDRPKTESAAVSQAMKRVATLRADYIYRNGTLELSRRPKRVKSRPIDKADHEQRQIERMMRQMEAIIRGTS